MKDTRLACDICGTSGTQASAGWFAAATLPGAEAIAFGPMPYRSQDECVVIEHLCEERCLHMRLNRWNESRITSPQLEAVGQ